MSVGFNSIFPKQTSINFTVKNVCASKKSLQIFNLKIKWNESKDLLNIPEVSEADIRHSLIKGELAVKLRIGDLVVVSSSIDLIQFDDEQKSFLESVGVTKGTSGGGNSGTGNSIVSFTNVSAMSEYTGPTTSTIFYVENIKELYLWDPYSEMHADGRLVVELTNVLGRAVRMCVGHPYWKATPVFYIDPLNGNDSNEGLSFDVPVKTIGEIMNRLNGKLTRKLTVWFINKPVSSDPLSGLVLVSSPDESISSEIPSLTIRSFPTTIISGTITAFTAKNLSTNACIKITDSSIADFTPYIGKRIKYTSGARVGCTSIIVAAPEANTAWLSETFNPEVAGQSSDPSNGNTYDIESLKIFDGSCGLPKAGLLSQLIDRKVGSFFNQYQVEYRDIEFDIMDNETLYFVASMFNNCTLSAPSYVEYLGKAVYMAGCTIKVPQYGCFYDCGTSFDNCRIQSCGILGGGNYPMYVSCNAGVFANVFVGVQFYQDARGCSSITSGFFNCTASSGVILATNNGQILIDSFTYGSGNVAGIRANRGEIRTGTSNPYLTATNYDLRVDNLTQVLGSIEGAAGSSLPEKVDMIRWADYNANGKVARSFDTGSSIIGN